MPAATQPKGSVSVGSIKPVTRKAVRCQREVAWLVTQAAGKLVATTDDVNAPTPSFVLAAALSYTREQEQTAQEDGHAIDYEAVMSPDLASFCAAAGLPAAPNALSDAGYMFTLSGADLIRDVYAYCSDLGERMGDAVQVKPGYAIKLALRLFLLDAATGNGSASKDNTCA
ncbi:hypothetical protein DW024_08280 [Collinsella sp. AF37-9]|uniref:hypothetical protein n=1 Tax=unclassified Collinsella TaxID=2637548 RepID=UPI000E52567C|nr:MULTISPECIES: hypothetical protein [unclassified Collinsella]RGW69454.1 hypothetical protein DWV58_07275 [Collinsella sp. AF11-11]RHL34934.1 hypothetical protein DW024_08280 [Collinsella sp. AF37-9]